MNGLIIVVNYEQELEIAAFLRRLSEFNPGLEVVVVDDGSKDSSAGIAENMGFRVLRHEENLGVGAAIRTGIEFARSDKRFDFVLLMSSNGKMRPEEIPRVIDPILTDRADYVQGSRFRKGGQAPSLSLFRRTAIPAYSLMASAILGARTTDITCGFRAYRLRLFDNPAVNLDQRWLDQYETEIYIHYHACRLGMRVVEVPVTIDYSHLEPTRKSKMKPFSGWWSLFRPLILLSLRIEK